MRIGHSLAAIAAVGLLTAPLQAANINAARSGASVEGEDLAGGLSGTVLIVGLIVALGALVAVAADDENVDLPASP